MTDLTNQSAAPRRAKHPGKGEYYAYFALIFAAALPIHGALHLASLAGLARRPEGGALRAAWSQARQVAPKIFWA